MDPENAEGESAIGSKKPSTQSNKNHQECWNSLQRITKWAIVDLWTKMLWESLEGQSQTDQEWAAWTHVPPTKECLGCEYHAYEPDWVYPRPPWYVGSAMRRDQEYTSWYCHWNELEMTLIAQGLTWPPCLSESTRALVIPEKSFQEHTLIHLQPKEKP